MAVEGVIGEPVSYIEGLLGKYREILRRKAQFGYIPTANSKKIGPFRQLTHPPLFH